VNLFEYADAAAAYDQAFRIYAELPNIDLRPFRMLWYQTGPYKAYYYSGRLQDTIDLADQTLYKTISEPVLEESFYWRALAKEAKGDIQGALADLHKAVEINPNFFVGWNQIRRIQGDG
jgi:tetratricopeptide (TPR) repeat protein